MRALQFSLHHGAVVKSSALLSWLALLTHFVLRLVINQCFRCCCVDFAPNADEVLRQRGLGAAVESEDLECFPGLLTVFKGNLALSLPAQCMKYQDLRSLHFTFEVGRDLPKLFFAAKEILDPQSWHQKVRLQFHRLGCYKSS